MRVDPSRRAEPNPGMASDSIDPKSVTISAGNVEAGAANKYRVVFPE